MPYVSGFLRVRHPGQPDNELPEGEGPVDPGYGIDMGEPHPDNGLPPIGPAYPNNGLPKPPPVFPPPTPSHPIVIAPPGTPPGTIWPSPGRPDNSLPSTPGAPDNTLPSQTFWVVAGIPGLGWRYIAVDPSLEVGGGPAPTPEPKTC